MRRWSSSFRPPAIPPEWPKSSLDACYRTIARRWKDLGHPTPIVWLGWGTTQGTCPWNALQDHSPGFGLYKDTLKRIADVYRHELPGCEIEWNHLRQPHIHVGQLYLGDDWVDIVGADLKAVVTDADWDEFARRTEPGGGPGGPIPFVELALSRGKRFAVAKWAVTNVDDDPASPYDLARYVRGMWDFFNRYKDVLSYECYFNRRGEHGDHRTYPAEYNPRASAAYRRLWHS